MERYIFVWLQSPCGSIPQKWSLDYYNGWTTTIRKHAPMRHEHIITSHRLSEAEGLLTLEQLAALYPLPDEKGCCG